MYILNLTQAGSGIFREYKYKFLNLEPKMSYLCSFRF